MCTGGNVYNDGEHVFYLVNFGALYSSCVLWLIFYSAVTLWCVGVTSHESCSTQGV